MELISNEYLYKTVAIYVMLLLLCDVMIIVRKLIFATKTIKIRINYYISKDRSCIISVHSIIIKVFSFLTSHEFTFVG